MDTPHATGSAAALHAPIRHFSGTHADIVGGLKELKALPQLAAALEQARAGAAATLHVFDQVVLQHHAEEEHDLFVSVQRSCRDPREADQVRRLVQRLTAQHREIERLWASLRPAVAMTAAGKVQRDPDFEGGARTLVDLYFAHARLEEEEFLPLADAILGRDANHMAALGVALHMRRVPAPSPYI